MRYELSGQEWAVIRPMLPNKPRGLLHMDDQRDLNVRQFGSLNHVPPDIFKGKLPCPLWRNDREYQRLGKTDVNDPKEKLTAFQIAEAAIPGNLIADILRLIAEPRPPIDPLPA